MTDITLSQDHFEHYQATVRAMVMLVTRESEYRAEIDALRAEVGRLEQVVEDEMRFQLADLGADPKAVRVVDERDVDRTFEGLSEHGVRKPRISAEPAEEVKPIGWYRTMTQKFAIEHFGFPRGDFLGQIHTASDGGTWGWCGSDWELLAYPPAPAEPAPTETEWASLNGVRKPRVIQFGERIPADVLIVRPADATDFDRFAVRNPVGGWNYAESLDEAGEISVALTAIGFLEFDKWEYPLTEVLPETTTAKAS